MLTRSKAFSGPFPAGQQWVDEARSRLGLSGGDDELVRAVAQGWMRLGSTRDATLVDTLFVLTDDRLGFGQTRFETTDPNWIDLSAVHAIDLIEGVPYPLDAVEVQFVGGLAIFVGWPEEFTTAVLTILREHGSRPAMAPLFSPSSPTSSGPPPTPASPPVPDDIAGLDDLEPHRPHTFDNDDPTHDADPRAAETSDVPTLGKMFSVNDPFEVLAADEPRGDVFSPDELQDEGDFPVDFEAIVASSTAPDTLDHDSTAEELFPIEAYPAEEPTAELRLAELAFFGHLEAGDEPAAATPDRPADPVPVELASVPDSAETVTGPWDDPSIAWPDAFRDSAFLGGHPIHQRRRKSCTVVLERRGLVAATPRSGGWQLHIPWQAVTRLDVQGADEIKFTHNQRVHSDGSVLVADLADGTTLLFEIRAKRPAAVRAAVAPIKEAIDSA